jgi:hypothetical protein
MKIKNPSIKSFILLILFTSCSSIEIFKENTEIAPYKEYRSFVIINQEIGQVGFNNALLDAQVSQALQNQMEELGLVYEREKPDLVIRYTSNEDPRQKEVYHNRYPMWGGRVWDPWLFNPMWMNNRYNPVTTKNYELLQLIVDFIDPQKDKMLMRLTAVSEINNEKEKKKKLFKSVDQVVESFHNHIKERL